MWSDAGGPALVARRWDWKDRAVAWLHQEVFGDEGPLPDTGATNVMVVGDTQAGKTTLLIRLLGVTDPQAVAGIESVLRAGRAKGNSATAAPIRYRWSSDHDAWMLVVGDDPPLWLADGEMAAAFARLRAAGGSRLTWDLNARPLEIGLPARLAAERDRRELRVLDLPGVFAASAPERDAAHALVTRFAPLMSVILLVEKVDNITGLEDAAIRDNPHLRGWMRDPQRFRVVLTSAFKDRTVKKRARRASSPEAAIERIRDYLAADIASTIAGAGAATLAPAVYPVDLGDSWNDLLRADPDYAARMEPARDRVLTDLAASLETAADEDALHLAAPQLAIRIADQIHARAEARRAELAAREADRDALGAELAETEGAVGRAAAARDEKLATLRRYRAVRQELGRRPVPYRRPAKPPMTGPEVREHQDAERRAWIAAAHDLWRDVLGAHGRPSRLPERAPLDEAALRRAYDAAVGCCGQCRVAPFFDFKGLPAPDHCYTRMSGASDAVAKAVHGQLRDAAKPTVARCEEEAAQAEQYHSAALRVRDDVAGRLAGLDARIAEQRHQHDVATARDELNLATARTLRAMLSRENQSFVEELAREADLLPPSERGWPALAAMQAVLDLNRMLEG